MSDPTVLTPEIFDEICRVTCPRCAQGQQPSQRDSTSEWVHTYGPGGTISHMLCLASGFRNSRFAKEVGRG